MRALCVALTAAAIVSTGCAGLIARSGRDLAELKDRAEVHAAFGAPESAAEADGQLVEEYVTRQKIADPAWIGPGYAIAYGMTLGLFDLVGVPYTLYLTGSRTVSGQHLWFTYDARGQVTAIQFEGMGVSLPFREPAAAKVPPSEVRATGPPDLTTAPASRSVPADGWLPSAAARASPPSSRP